MQTLIGLIVIVAFYGAVYWFLSKEDMDATHTPESFTPDPEKVCISCRATISCPVRTQLEAEECQDCRVRRRHALIQR